MSDASTIRNFTIKSLQQFYEKLDLDTKLADYVTKGDLSGEGFLSSESDPTVPSYVKSITQANINSWNNKIATESDPIFSASAAAGITSENITSWNDKVSNVQSDWNATSGLAQILNKPDLSDYFDDVEYDKTNKLINFKHNNVVKDTLDATDFIKDGMVDTAYLGKGTTTGKENKDCLIIRFNTDAGKEDIEILLADIFNPDNYYDMTDADDLFVTKAELSSKSYVTSTALDTRLNTAGYISSIPNEYVTDTELSAKSYVTSSALNTRLNTAGYISSIPSEYVTDTELSAKGYITSFTETDPTVPTHVKSITTTDISNWNSKTSNTGTITGITMNGASKGTSGVVDLGTVLTEHQDISGKQDVIDDLDTIRSNASAGAAKVSNVQSDWNATSGLAQILNKPSIPAAVTESTVSGWGFTKNAGTITGITMNGSSKGTSGIVNLGTVLTEHQDISGKQDTIDDLDTIRSNASAGAAKVSNVQADWNATSGLAQILNKPTIPSITGLATETYVTNKVAELVDSAPDTLNTLNELAAALGDDANFSTTIATQIGEKVSKAELSAQGYLTSFTETDPTVPTHVKSITQANINNWNSYANVQADWNITDSTSNAYIKNKPTIPSIEGLSYVPYIMPTATTDGILYSVNSGDIPGYFAFLSNIFNNEYTYSVILGAKTENKNGGRYGVFNSYGPYIILATTHGTPGFELPSESTRFETTGIVYQQLDSEKTYYFPWITPANELSRYKLATLGDIPSEVTESTVSGWGFTKNTGTLTGVTFNGSTASVTNGIAAITAAIPSDSSLVHTTGQETIDGKKIIKGELSLGGSDGGLNSKITLDEDSQINMYLSSSYIYLSNIDITNGSSVNIKNSDWSYIKRVGSGNSTVTLQDDLNAIKQVPSYSSSDAGKVLSVNSSGQLVWITPVSIYTGSGEPSNSTGNDGDIYLQQ